MKNRFIIAWGLALFGMFVTSCTHDVAGGNPTIPLADPDGTTRVFNVTLDRLERAVTNAFDLLKYQCLS